MIMKKYTLLLLFSCLGTFTLFAQPVITSFTPLKAEVGENITITGSGFSATASSNEVFFGSVKAVVSSASTTQLVVAVPKSSMIAPISVIVSNKIAESRTTFHVINSAISTNSINNNSNWGSIISFASGNASGAEDMKIVASDFDGNGFVDVAKIGSGAINVHRNLMASGATIATSSFGAATQLTTSGTANTLIVKDVNSDGLLDIISSSTSGIDIFRNTSTIGSISFAAKITITSSSSDEVRAADFDRDGLIDIVGFSGSSVNIYRNATLFSTLQTISFSAVQSFTLAGAIEGIDVGDMNLDGKIDVVTQQASTLQILLNTHTSGTTFAFSATPALSGMGGQNTKVADLDDDGDMDVYSSNWKLARNDNPALISSTNVSTLNVLSFTIYEYSMGISFADFNGNGRIDIIGGTSWDKSWININQSLPLTNSSFAYLNYTGMYQPGGGSSSTKGTALGIDLNGDDKVDFLSASRGNSQFVVVQNNMVPVGLSISGALTNFAKCANMASAIQQFTVSGVSLTTGVTVTPPDGFEVSTSNNFANNIGTIAQPLTFGAAGNVTQVVYVRMIAGSNGSFSGNIQCSSGTYPIKNVSTSGTTIESPSITGSTYVLTLPGTVSLTGSGTAATSNIWTSSNTGTATISSSGLVTAVAPGATTITYTTNLGCQATKGIAVLAPAPTISSFTPASGSKIGSSITINGTNFSSTAANNTVWFGGVKAVVTAASTSQLTVTVPKTTAISELTVVVSNAVSNKKYFPLKNTDAGTLSLTWNSTYFQSASYKSLTNQSAIWNFEMADMNSDGLLDWVVPGIGKVSIMLNPGANNSFSLNNVSQTAITTTTNENCTALKLVDLNNDGFIDILCGMSNNQVQIIKNNGNNTYTSQGVVDFSSLYGDNINSISFSDVNNDGYLDIMATIYGTYSATKFQVFAQDPANPFSFVNYYNTCDVGNNIFFVKSGLLEDLNGDNKEDAFFLQYQGGAKRSNGTTTGFTNAPSDLGSDSDMEGYTDGYFVDFEDDGDLDLIYPGESNYRIFKNNGSGALSLTSVSQHSRFGHLFDIDNDGDKDIVGSTFFGISGAKNSNNTSFTAETSFLGQPSGNEYSGSSKLVDLNGDGYLDVSFIVFDYDVFKGTKIATAIFQGNTDPSINITGSLTAFQKCTGVVSASQSVSYNCLNLQSALTVTPPTGFEVSASSTFTTVGTSSAPLTIGTSGNFSGTVYIRMIASANSANYNAANIQFAALNAPTQTISCQGSTLTTTPVITTTSGYTCGTGTVALSASATNSPTAYAYYSASTGGSLLSSTSTYTTPSLSLTTTYYVEATNVCGTNNTTNNPRIAVTASVYSAPSITSQSIGAQTICQGFSPTPLSVNATGTNLTYQWYSNLTESASGGTSLGSANGAQTSSYTPSTAALGTMYYYCIVSGSCTPSATSAVSGVFAVQGPLAGTIAVTGTNPICTGSSTVLSLSGHSGSIQWQSSSTLNGTYSDIAGATSPTYSTGVLTSTTYFIAKLSFGSCTSVYTSSQTITVSPLSVAGTISGTAGVCSGSTSALTLTGNTGTIVWTSSTALNGTYSPIAGATSTSYTTSAITAITYYKAVVTSGACASATTAAYTVSTTPLGTIGAISGPSTATLGGTATYSVTAVANATSYVWNLPAGMTLTSSANNGASITVSVANNFAGGTLTAQAVGCTNSAVVTRTVNVPSASSLSITTATSGAPVFCGGTTASFSTTTTSTNNTATYTWTLPTGVSVASGSSLSASSINVVFASNYNGGTISVTRVSSTETLSSSYSVGAIATPGVITGASSLCGSSSGTYTIASVSGADSYEWSLPTGMSITSGTGTIMINTSWTGSITGSIKVRAVKNSCGTSAWRTLSVASVATPGAITGPTTTCGANSNTISASGTNTTTLNTATYSISAVTGATGYTWTVPTGMAITSGQGTTSINVTITPSLFTSGSVTVVTTTSTCTSAVRSLSISSANSTVVGPTDLCGLSQATYSINAPSGATVTWTLASWMSLASGQSLTSNPITVNIGAAPSQQNITASYATSCGTVTGSRFVGCNYFSQLENTYCGASGVSLTDWLYAINSPGATGYKFKVTGQGSGAGWVSTSVNGVVTSYYELERPNRTVRFGLIPGVVMGTSYSIEVAVKTPSGVYTSYGASCTVSLGSYPTTQIQSSQCSSVDISLVDWLYADNVLGATGYKFKVTGQGSGAGWVSTTVNGVTMSYYELERPNRTFRFGLIPGVIMSTSYMIEVSVKGPDGVYGVYGPSCTSSLAGIPTTQLQSSQCASINVELTDWLYADNVLGATGYKFRVMGQGSGTGWVSTTVNGFTTSYYELVRPNRTFRFSMIPGVVMGTDYEVQVAVKAPDGVYGLYGPICTVGTTDNYQGYAQQDPQLHEAQTEGIQTEEVTIATETTASITETISTTTWAATATSNPFATSFQIKLNGAEGISTDATFTAQLTDMSGKVYSQATLSKEQLEAASFGEQLAPGMYLLTLRQGEEFRVIRVVKR